MSNYLGTVRHRTLTRCLAMVEHLKARRATLSQLAQVYGVCKRTIRRDLDALSLAGVPVRKTTDAAADGLEGFWWVER